jgi:hypothetical protein
VGIRHRDDLARVRRIAQDFLVAGQRRIEDDLAGGLAAAAERLALEERAVLEREQRGRRAQRIGPILAIGQKR